MTRMRVLIGLLIVGLAVGTMPAAATSDAPDATTNATNASTDIDGLTRVDIRISAAEGSDGVEFIGVEIADPDVATVAGVDFRAPGDGTTHVIGEAHGSVSWHVDDAAANGTVIASVFVRGEAAGSTELRITDVWNLTTAGGSAYNVTTDAATISVGGGASAPTNDTNTTTGSHPPALGGNGTATDPDGDNNHEDVTGDGIADARDVLVFLHTFESAPGAYDLNGDGRVSIVDVGQLFSEVIE